MRVELRTKGLLCGKKKDGIHLKNRSMCRQNAMCHVAGVGIDHHVELLDGKCKIQIALGVGRLNLIDSI